MMWQISLTLPSLAKASGACAAALLRSAEVVPPAQSVRNHKPDTCDQRADACQP